MPCPALEDLLELLRGQIVQEKRVAIDLHLSTGCKICVENYDWLKRLVMITAQDDSFEFSEETLAWSVAQFKAASAASLRQRMLAQIVFDSLVAPQPAEVRAAPALASSRQMLFQTEIYDIDLRLERKEDAKSMVVIGQILCSKKRLAELAGLAVRWTLAAGDNSGKYEIRTETNARGMFHLTGLVLADYELEIFVPEGEILIRGISIA